MQSYDNKPVCVADTFGRGRAMIFSISLSSQWVNLPDRGQLVPLMRAIVGYLDNGNEMHLNLQPGEPLELRSGDVRGNRAVVSLPDGSSQDAEVIRGDGGSTVRFANTGRPGRYQLSLRDADNNRAIPFIVRSLRDASDLTPIEPQKLTRIEQMLDMHRVDAQSPDMIVVAFDRIRPRALWGPLVLIAVALIVVDVALSWMMGRRGS
ncbi:MAG: hypothetical protein JO353_01205 [Phycisphaerae bacterium]|nr:hypothetical protein [Phycisphaerae bacterium]